MELAEAIASKGLTTLRLVRDDATGKFELTAAREWDDGVDWSRYGRSFRVDQVPCAEPRVHGDREARGLLAEAGAAPTLARLEELMTAGRHEMVVVTVHRPLGMRVAHHVHCSWMGVRNGFGASRAGGVRRHEPDEPELDVFLDGLNLARGMSYKNAAALIPFGGCKMTLRAAPFALDDHPRLGFLAFCIDRGRFLTGPDMGFVPELADALRARFTRQIVGGPGGSMGPTGTPTARGTLLALKEHLRVAFDGDELRGRVIALQGLGAVGLPLARLLADAGAKLVVADTDGERLARAEKLLAAAGIVVVKPERLLETECDVLSPCAMGGIFDETTIDALRCKVICGAANNQLHAVSREGEIALAARLKGRGIVYAPEWIHNIAGVVAGVEEYTHQDDARIARILPHLDRVCRDGVRAILARAVETGRTPTELAYEEVEARIYPPTA